MKHRSSVRMSQRSRANCRWYKTSLDCYHMFSVTIMANNEIEATVTYSFLCGIRGFHIYKEVWRPILRERLNLSHERKNLHDRYAIAAYKISAFLDGFLTQSLVTYPEIPNYRSVLNFPCLIFAFPNFSESLISTFFYNSRKSRN